jgi:hypothetical protein
MVKKLTGDITLGKASCLNMIPPPLDSLWKDVVYKKKEDVYDQ